MSYLPPRAQAVRSMCDVAPQNLADQGSKLRERNRVIRSNKLLNQEIDEAWKKGLAWTKLRPIAKHDGTYDRTCQGCNRMAFQLKKTGEILYISYATELNGRHVVCSKCVPPSLRDQIEK